MDNRIRSKYHLGIIGWVSVMGFKLVSNEHVHTHKPHTYTKPKHTHTHTVKERKCEVVILNTRSRGIKRATSLTEGELETKRRRPG